MKSKKFLLALAVPMAFAACSNEEFIANNMAPTEGNLVELGDNFVLTGQQAAGSTRSIWESATGGLKWSWLPDPTAATAELNSQLGTGSPVKVKADEIGLCWTGELPDGTGNIGSNVYTNYQFLHNGWLAEDEDVADLDICTGVLKNGKLYPGINALTLSSSSDQDAVKARILDVQNEVDGKKLNLNTGVFKTDNKAIFGGSYIVYYPYNEDFADAGTLPVKSETNFADVTVGEVSAAHVAKNTVLVGYAKDLIGGSQASKFSMNPLSGIISLQISQEGASKTIEKVALWSEDGFVTNVNLDAAKIKANGANGGEALYVEGTKQTKSTIVAELATPQALSATAVKVYLPVLPTTAKDLKVILYTQDDKVAVISTGKDYTIGAAQGVIVEAKAKEADFKDTKIAVDAATLEEAVSTAGSKDKPVNVTVIGDISLNKDVIGSGNLSIKQYVTVNGGKIIVEPGFTLTLNNNSTVLSDIDVEGQDCCTTENAGQLSLTSATIGGEINILAGYNADKQDGKMTIIQNNIVTVKETATINNYGEVEVGAATATSQTLVNLSGTINNYGELTILKSTQTSSGSVDRDAKIAVLANGHFNNKANGSTTVEGVLAVYPGEASNEGVIYDKVSSQITGNIADLSGDYICEVDNNTNRFSAALNERPTTIIKFVNAGNYDMDKIKGSVRENKIEKYVVAATGVVFQGSKTGSYVKQTIKNLEVEKGADLTVTTNSSVNGLYLTVTGNVDIAGEMTLNKSTKREAVVFNAGTVNVKYNKEESIFGKLEIGDAVRSKLGTLNIEGTDSNTASATNSGSATFGVNSVTTASVAIINKGYALITLASGTTSDVSAFVFYTKDAAKPSGNGVWANGVPTPEIEY